MNLRLIDNVIDDLDTYRSAGGPSNVPVDNLLKLKQELESLARDFGRDIAAQLAKTVPGQV